MEIRPILSAILRNKTGAILLAIQIALTLAVVVNAMFIVQQRLKFIGRPTGIDIENIIVISSQGFGSSYDHEQTVFSDLELLRAIPGVKYAAHISRFPLSGGGSRSGFTSTTDSDAESVGANYYFAQNGTIDALGVKLAAGRDFLPTEILTGEQIDNGVVASSVLITKALAEKLFPDGNALGNLVYGGTGDSSRVVGIIEKMHGAWVSWDGLNQVLIFPGLRKDSGQRYLVRTEPGQRDRLIPEVESVLEKASVSRYLDRMEPMSEMVGRSYDNDRVVANGLIIVIVLLVSITGLGIVGLASFLVRQRTKQVGTRRALGAQKYHIVRYFLVENWLITTMGVVVGTVMAFGLNYWTATEFSLPKLDPVFVPVGILGIWVLGVLAAAGPAKRASNISPAIATRTV